MTIRAIPILTTLLVVCLVWSGCKKDEEPEPDPATLKFEFAFKVGGEDLVFGQSYNINGTAVSFDAVNY